MVHTFTANGTLTLPSSLSANVLVVAGGGGGGGLFGDGGGAGGLIYTNLSLSGATYGVTVGAGGNGTTANTSGANGTNSVFSHPDRPGRRRRRRWLSKTMWPGKNGGSGGGGGGGELAPALPPAQASSLPAPVVAMVTPDILAIRARRLWRRWRGRSVRRHPNGGNGLQYAISGVTNYYAGGGGGINGGGTGGLGGGGSPAASDNAGGNGAANTGGGGGGGWNASGGSGGSGIVIVRYPYVASPPLSVTLSSPTNGQYSCTGSSVSATAFVAWWYDAVFGDLPLQTDDRRQLHGDRCGGAVRCHEQLYQSLDALPVGAYQCLRNRGRQRLRHGHFHDQYFNGILVWQYGTGRNGHLYGSQRA